VIEEVIALARTAGERIEAVRAGQFSVETKDGDEPVTEADRAADRVLREGLLALRPCGWLSEETRDDQRRLSQRALWIVDPLDGTKEFIEGVPEYAVAVALVEEGLPVLGVVHNPVTGHTVSGQRSRGGRLEGRALQVMESNRVLCSRSELARGEFEPFRTEWELVPMGSIEYKLALVARGEAGVVWSRGPKWEWDVCAGALLVQEAGGIVTDIDGNELRFNQEYPKVRGVLAGAPRAHARALRAIQRVGVSDRMSELDRT
jgi:myo-inositol-1(or 4)-monophosphatase